mmetsp:Transcript_38521/g.41788  ORF Transcript_38521/g.41788 Transcript_38521/m.41788 type:complete len:152 (+) Transcript_38521:416-871(+)
MMMMTSLLLLPTLSNEPRTDRRSIEKYFELFMKHKPKGRIIKGHIRIGADGSWAHDSGIYEFTTTTTSTTTGSTSPKITKTTAASIINDSDFNDNNNNNNNNNDSNGNNNNNKVNVIQARYSFLYMRNDQGEWKIAHHHSSLMPEQQQEQE